MSRHAAAALAAVVLLAGADASAAPPPVERLFGCPLLVGAEAFRPLNEWRTRKHDAVATRLSTPADWEIEQAGGVVSARAPHGRLTLTVRRGTLVSPERLDFVRRSVELTELGPSHAGPDCEAGLVRAVRQVTGWSDLQVGVYGRPLAGRQRSYALFVALPDGTLTVVVTARWRKRDAGPDLDTVRRLLGGVLPPD